MNLKKTAILILTQLILTGGLTAKAVSYGDREISLFDITTEYKENPINIDVKAPRFSWKVNSTVRNTMQEAYQIQCATTIENLEKGAHLLWDSKRIKSAQSLYIKYAGKELESMQQVYWRVKVWSNNGTSNCSKINYFETGLFSISEWKAKWIKTDKIKDPKHSISPYFRKEFVVNKKVKKARVYASAIGLYELHLNGNKVGDEYFTPGFTSYRKRIQYQVYDITKNIMNGDNALGFVLGNGWAVNFIQNWGKPKVNENIKPTMAGIVQVVIDYEDGTQDVIITDNKWKTSTGPILSSTIYGGESYDARKEQTGWDRIGFDDSQWEPTSILDESLDILVGAQGEPVIKNEIINPIKIWKNDKGEVIADMGQNMVGWVQLKINGNRGDKITLKHAEVLDSQGHFYTGNLRRAKQIIDYTLKGEGEEIYEPHFTCT